MHRFANPGRFMRIASAVFPWTAGLSLLLFAVGLFWALVVSPVDYQQGDIRRRLNEDVLRHVFRVSFTVAPRLFRSILPPDEAARVKGVLR